MPATVGVQLVLYVAVDVPPLVLMPPLPLTPATATVHDASLYSVNVTLPVGAAAPVEENVAVSPTVTVVPATITVVGLACVVMLGDALLTVMCSLLSPHLVVKPLLLPSPA